MDSLRAYISDTDMYLHMVGQKPKIAKISDNEQMVDIMRLQPVITKEEFENTMPNTTAEDCLYKAIYLKSLELQSVLSN